MCCGVSSAGEVLSQEGLMHQEQMWLACGVCLFCDSIPEVHRLVYTHFGFGGPLFWGGVGHEEECWFGFGEFSV